LHPRPILGGPAPAYTAPRLLSARNHRLRAHLPHAVAHRGQTRLPHQEPSMFTDTLDDTDILARKMYEVAPEVNADQRLVTGYISTPHADMHGDVVLPDAMDADTYFATTRSVNLDHNPTAVVGTNRNLSARPQGVYAVTYVSKTALGEDVLTMIKEGVI